MGKQNLDVDLSILLGKIIVRCEWNRGKSTLLLIGSDGMHYSLGGFSSDGGSVYLEDQNGKLEDLLNSPILRAEEKTVEVPVSERTFEKSFEALHFFYELATIKGTVHLRFYGTEGMYYAASAWFHNYVPEYGDPNEKH